MSDEPRDYQLLLIPKGGGETRSWEIGADRLALLRFAGAAVGVVLLVGLVSWLVLARQAARVPGLRAEIASLEADRARIETLAGQLEAIEERYGGIRRLFGIDTIRDPTDLWLPPSTQPTRAAAGEDPENARPGAWPLSQPGFITQPLLDGAGADHPGLDIAVPTDTYIRASASGVVVEVGDDPIYGRYVLLDHGEGWTTLYGHAARTSATQGQRVRRGEVIAMSGSTGRSTAPHLHFEIRLDGEPVDPLEYVRQPG